MTVETALESIALLDFTPEIKCESVEHATSEIHEGPAEFFQHAPCASSTGYRCGRYVRAVLGGTHVVCYGCGVEHELSFTPLNSN